MLRKMSTGFGTWKKGSSGFNVKNIYTSELKDLTPEDHNEIRKIWSLEPSEDLFYFASKESETIDVFVSHVWWDLAYAEAKTAEVGDAVMTEIYYFSAKTAGVEKACRVLDKRARFSVGATHPLAALRKPMDEWRLWMDHTCVNQDAMDHKIHVIGHFKEYINRSAGLVVLLSPTYFERLWCLFEMSCFLALKELDQIACYCWPFMDGRPQLIQTYIEALRNLAVENAKCKVEKDREHLDRQVAKYFVSKTAFSRFGQLAGLAMILQSLLLSPAVFTAGRYKFFVEPFLELAGELGFKSLRDALGSFDAVGNYKKVSSAVGSETNPELNEVYTAAVLTRIRETVHPLMREEAQAALKK